MASPDYPSIVAAIVKILNLDKKLATDERARVVRFDTDFSAWLRDTAGKLRDPKKPILPETLGAALTWEKGLQETGKLLWRAAHRGLGRRLSFFWARLRRLVGNNPSVNVDLVKVLTEELDRFATVSNTLSSLMLLDPEAQIREREDIANQCEVLASQFEAWAAVLRLKG